MSVILSVCVYFCLVGHISVVLLFQSGLELNCLLYLRMNLNKIVLTVSCEKKSLQCLEMFGIVGMLVEHLIWGTIQFLYFALFCSPQQFLTAVYLTFRLDQVGGSTW